MKAVIYPKKGGNFQDKRPGIAIKTPQTNPVIGTRTQVVVRGFRCFTMFSRDVEMDGFCASGDCTISGFLSGGASVHGDRMTWYLASLESGDSGMLGVIIGGLAGRTGAEIWCVRGRLWNPWAGKDTERKLSLSWLCRPDGGDFGDLAIWD